MQQARVECDKCKKIEREPTHWASIHYEDTFGSNDGAGPCTGRTNETYDLCVKCKQEFYKWLKQGEKNG